MLGYTLAASSLTNDQIAFASLSMAISGGGGNPEVLCIN